MPKQQKTAYSSSRKLWKDLAAWLVLTDRGTQFYANKRDKNGNADSKFENFLVNNKIKHINSRVNHPTSRSKEILNYILF